MREGWKINTLADVYDVRDGTHESPKYQEEGYPLITSKNLKNGVVTFDKIKFISEKDYININNRSKVNIGDVLFAMIGTIGNPTVITEEPNYAIKNVALFKVDSSQSGQFLKYYLESQEVIDKMLQDAKGSTQRFVGLGYLRKFKIPTPPLSEQEQIVEILDEAFAAIDQVKANIEKNIQNSKELFQSKLNDIFSHKGDSWEEKKFSEILKMKSGDGLTAKNMIDGDYPVYGGNGIAGYHNKFNLDKERIIIGRVGALCGNVRYINEPIWLTDNAFQVTEMKFKFDLEFLTILLNFKDLRKLARQSAQPVISNSSVKDLILEFPTDISEQISIRKKIKGLEEVTSAIIRLYINKIDSLLELKKSILQKAFTGELTNKTVEV